MQRIVICVLFLMLGVLPAQAQPDDMQKALDGIIAEYADADDPALVLQLTTPDGTWTATGGMATENRVAMPHDRFSIGLMSRTFVASAALLLVEDGILDLDGVVSTWLSDEIVTHIANLDRVTLRQLLGMRSGIDDYQRIEAFWEVIYSDPTYQWTVTEALQYIYDLPPRFAPDAEYSYSNSNYLLAQLVLEAAAGMPLHTLIRQRILEPLRLDGTYTEVSETLPGAFINDDEAQDMTNLNIGTGLPERALVSTADDLTAFYRALLQDQSLLNSESMDALLSFQPAGEFEFSDYSLGLSRWKGFYGDEWGHTGGFYPITSIGVYVPNHEIIVIVLSANTIVSTQEVAWDALEMLYWENFEW
jgi:D-alanyl-D-alanine carboxypeptidase